MQFDTVNQFSATYARNHFKEVMDRVSEKGAQIVIRKSQPTILWIRLDEYEKSQNSAKPKKKKKFDLEEIRKNNTFYKYIGCMENDPDFKGLTSVQIAKKWTDYVD
jgi:prevent-host-death family protein